MMGLSGKSRFVKQENLKPVIIFECDDEAMHPNYGATPNEGLIMTDIEAYLTIAIEHIKKQGCKNVFQLCNGCPLKHADEINDVNLCYWIREYNKDDSATPSHAVSETKQCEICGHDMTMVDCDFWVCPDYPHNAQDEFECHIDDHA